MVLKAFVRKLDAKQICYVFDASLKKIFEKKKSWIIFNNFYVVFNEGKEDYRPT